MAGAPDRGLVGAPRRRRQLASSRQGSSFDGTALRSGRDETTRRSFEDEACQYAGGIGPRVDIYAVDPYFRLRNRGVPVDHDFSMIDV